MKRNDNDAEVVHEFDYTQDDFERLRTLVFEQTGIKLSDHKQEMLYSRLARRLRALHLQSFADYYGFLTSIDGEQELTLFANAITTNLTFFFRENHHFEYLEAEALPILLERNQDSRRLRIWSAGCASGEEPYSIAMILQEQLPPFWDAKILATDLDSSAVARAQRGIYSMEQLSRLNPQQLESGFIQLNAEEYQVNKNLKKLIVFKQLNLMQAWKMRGPFDMIFCRNVMIYFDKPTQRLLVDRFANLMATQAYLLIGHSESLFKVSDRFRLVKQTIYTKEH